MARKTAGASQQQLAAMKSVVRDFGMARGQAETTLSQAKSVHVTLAETAVQITASVRAIEKIAARQKASVVIIEEQGQPGWRCRDRPTGPGRSPSDPAQACRQGRIKRHASRACQPPWPARRLRHDRLRQRRA